jgi:cytochrome P450
MTIDPANPVPPQIPRIAGRASVPAHIPESLILPCDIPFGQKFLDAPYEYMANLHETMPPIFYGVSDMGNAWQLMKYEDALFMLRESSVFSNEGATPFPRDPNDYFYFIPIEIDPPDHRKYRAILDPVFSPKGVLELEENIRSLANRLMDDFIDKGECDFTTAFGRPLPVSVFLDLMGLPQEKCDTFVMWAVNLLHAKSRESMAQAMKSISDYLKEVIAEKTANPDGKVISRIVHAQVDGRAMTPPEIFGFVIFLFIGGLDTVFATLNNIWLWLAENPDRCKEMRDNPDKITSQIEELLRVFSVTFSGRLVNQDYELRGVKMKKGDRVSAMLPVCNYDPDAFPDPKRVDFNRKRKFNLAFAGGPHGCMGAHLARLEIRIALEEWLRRIPAFSLKPNTRIEYRPGGVVGPERVPLVW